MTFLEGQLLVGAQQSLSCGKAELSDPKLLIASKKSCKSRFKYWYWLLMWVCVSIVQALGKTSKGCTKLGANSL